MGPNSLDFPDFEFWWMRFSAGNFDLKDPKYRTITDLPVNIFEKICENLGDNYQNEYRFTLRKVCKSFRSLADSWIPKFEKLVIEAYDFPDFEFWWMRFSAGNFDLDYDRSRDPKYRTITDLPVNIFEKICENLGDNYQNEYRFTLRKVCKSFRSLADSWIPKFEKLVIEAYGKDVALNFNERYFYYKDQNLALNDLISIIAHPEHKLNNLCIASYLNKQFSKKLALKLESMNIKIHAESIYMNYENWRDQKRLLTLYEAETVKMVYIKGSEKKMVKFIKEICELEQEERAGDDQNSKNGNLKPRKDRPDIFHYPIPNSTDFLEIEIQRSHIRIERKSVNA
ncbi:unnamed protein product [Caenorhabditis nigoni]